MANSDNGSSESAEVSGDSAAPAASSSAIPAEFAVASDAAGGESASVDLEAGAILGDVVNSGDVEGDLSDLHAALASLSDDTFAYLDVALDHLTDSLDLFDIPALDIDSPDDCSAS